MMTQKHKAGTLFSKQQLSFLYKTKTVRTSYMLWQISTETASAEISTSWMEFLLPHKHQSSRS